MCSNITVLEEQPPAVIYSPGASSLGLVVTKSYS